MIRLHIPNLSALLQRHYAAVGPLVRGRARAFSELLHAQCLGQRLPARPVPKATRYGLHGTHLNACVSVLCPSGTTGITNKHIAACLTGSAQLPVDPVYWPLATDLVRLLREVADSAELLLTGEPALLEDLTGQILSRYPALVQNNLFTTPVQKVLAQVFNYDYFTTEQADSTWDAYQLTQELGVGVCPYCNHNYTLTVHEASPEGEPRAIRPHLDHFFSKARHPLLAISFYNLIPCCSVCNSSLKGQQVFSLQTHVHPYLQGFGLAGRFRYGFDAPAAGQVEPTITVELEVEDGPHQARITGSINSFLLRDIYRYHTDIVQEMLFKKQAYSETYLAVLTQQYEKLNLTREQLYRQAFGGYLQETDFGRRPLSKLIRDLAVDMGMLPESEAG